MYVFFESSLELDANVQTFRGFALDEKCDRVFKYRDGTLKFFISGFILADTGKTFSKILHGQFPRPRVQRIN